MKTTFSGILALTLVAGFAISGCKKKDDPAPTPPPPSGPVQPTGPAKANLTASINNEGGTLQSNAFAQFRNDANVSVNVGDVSFNGTPLDQSFGWYGGEVAFQSSSPNTWVVEGANGFQGFTENMTQINFPTIGNFTSPGTTTSNSSFTLSANVSGADSVSFSIFSPATITGIDHAKAGSSGTHTFTAAEMAGLGTGTMIVSIAGIKYFKKTIGGKIIQFEKSYSSSGYVVIN
jgi:hypothetical protein